MQWERVLQIAFDDVMARLPSVHMYHALVEMESGNDLCSNRRRESEFRRVVITDEAK